MLFIVETAKDFETAAKDLEEAVKRRKYGVFSVTTLRRLWKAKGSIFRAGLKSSKFVTRKEQRGY